MVLKSLFGTLVLAALAISANADLAPIPVGDIDFSGSWNQTWGWAGFDAFAIRYVSGTGGPFQHPALEVGDVNWEILLDTPTLASAKGPYVDWTDPWLMFTIYGAGDSLDNIIFDIATFKDEVWQTTIRYYDDDWVWTSDWRPTYASVVPLPGAAFLGLVGMVAGTLKLRRFV